MARLRLHDAEVTFDRALLPAEISGGEVRILFTDHGTFFDGVPSTLLIEVLDAF